MAIELQFDPAARLAVISQVGDLDVPFLTEAERLLDQAAVDPSCDLVLDLKRVANAPSMIAGLALGSFWADHRTRFLGRVAAVAPPPLHSRKGLAVMEAAARIASVDLHVFDSQAACDEWLAAATACDLPGSA